ncbi:LysR family transcriptional regulator [Polynucleobacter sp. MWH-Loch1C5]|uniref:LysR family transcriptional regulator n=1 Tax=Polynucleobacter sp. MWH-Loch1C5 TaxID=2689108 RepID=UPI001C0D30B6|nr:LysR family transcriptional regulator [Polynucleobacter sp. MWH-Loch1C5]MBU3541947.1 LysR family transcriptional regulator [Polynucleobacter sp. MWH-Loch1C5]
MELRHLKYFIAVAEEKNFTRASERLFIAQPPLSRSIQQLEDELGVALFERGSRPLKLTQAGEFFFAHAQELLNKSKELKSMTQRVGQISKTLSIGFVASTMYGKFPKIIRLYRAKYSTVDLNLIEMSTMDQLRALKEGNIDVGFGRVRHEDSNIRRIILREEKLMCAVPIGHKLLELQRAVSAQDMSEDNLIVYPKNPRPSFADQVLNAFRDRAVEPKKITEVRDLQIAIGLVAAGEGIAVVPRSLQGMKRDDVVYLELNEKHAVSPIIMSVRAMDKSHEIQDMLNLIYDIYDEEGIPHTKESL